MDSMFYNCRKLVSIDLSSFNTSLVTNFNYIFIYCYSLEYIDLENSMVNIKVDSFSAAFSGIKDNSIICTNDYKWFIGVTVENITIKCIDNKTCYNEHKCYKDIHLIIIINIFAINVGLIIIKLRKIRIMKIQ